MTTAIKTTIATKTEHQIPEALLQKKVQIPVVGCGGTGSAIAAGLPYLHQAMAALGHPHGLDVSLVDGDRISRSNCFRQPFSEAEATSPAFGQAMLRAVSKQLTKRYGQSVGFVRIAMAGGAPYRAAKGTIDILLSMSHVGNF